MGSSQTTSKTNKNTASGKTASDKRSTANKNTKATKVSAKNPETKSRTNVQPENEEKKGLSMVTAVALGLLFGFILELSNFDVLGPVGSVIKKVELGLFGSLGYLFPVFVFLLFILATFEKGRAGKLILSIVMFILLCAIAHLMTPELQKTSDVLSFFKIGAERKIGGGIVGGAVALLLNSLLSHTGAVIITIVLILTCIFFMFQDSIRQFFEGRRNDPEEESCEKKRTAVAENRVVKFDDSIYAMEDEEGTVIRIVKSKKKRKVSHNTPLVRSAKKARPLRDDSTNILRAEKKVRGVGTRLDVADPSYANGDEMHEITNYNVSGRNRTEKKKSTSRNFFEDTSIKSDDRSVKWEEDTPKEKTIKTASDTGTGKHGTGKRNVSVKKDNIQAVPERNTKSDGRYNAPPMELLNRIRNKNSASAQELERIADNLEIILRQFGVNVTITDIQAGPSVTRFELQPEMGTRVNKITSLENDLKLNLGVTEIRIEAPIPGRQAVGIEIPNKNRQTVYMRELLEDESLMKQSSRIAFAAGKDISGNVIVADIAKMPHLLVAGTTGSGKSVFLNTILMTILYRAKPEEVGLIIIDPKKVEFGVYAGIPHLMKDVVTDPGQAVSTLRWAVNEMTNRYVRMQQSSVRDFKSYNQKVEKGTVSPEEENPRKMNQIVIIIDELADLMMVAKKEAEALICRLAQLARAAGIHLIIATQRPSVDVVTGLIKANVPARVALLVSSQIDSRTIIDMPGAEKLLGNGDMLFYPTGYVKPVRVQGAFVSDDEIIRTVDYLKKNNSVDYFAAEASEIDKFISMPSEMSSDSGSDQNQDSGDKYDECFYEAGKLCIEFGKASSSMLQRRFNLGFNRAARIIDQLEEFGAVGPQNGAKPRQILVDMATFEEMYREMKNNH